MKPSATSESALKVLLLKISVIDLINNSLKLWVIEQQMEATADILPILKKHSIILLNLASLGLASIAIIISGIIFVDAPINIGVFCKQC